MSLVTFDESRRAVIEAAVKMQPASDPRSVFARLRAYAQTAINEPRSLTEAEIRQVGFALSVYLALELDP